MKLYTTIILAVLIAVLFEVSFFAEVPHFDYSSEIANKQITFSEFSQARLPFIENQGQLPELVKYYAKTFAGTVYVTDSDLTYYAIKKENDRSIAIREIFLGNVLNPSGVDKSQAVVNYFKGTQENWQTNIPTFNIVSLGTIWPHIGVDLKVYGNNVEKIFTIGPGGSPSNIKVEFDGISELSFSQNNELVVNTELGSLTLSKPVAYQMISGKKNPIDVSYTKFDDKTYGFSVSSYDPKYDLVIDPLIASTLIGGNDYDFANDFTLDANNNVYVIGSTTDASIDYPTTVGAFDTTHNGLDDVFVSKFNNDLTTLSASTFIGADSYDEGSSIALDSSGSVYITGFTYDGSSAFPTTTGAYNETTNGGYDTFVSKFNNNLSNLTASTLIGAGGDDYGQGIAIDSSDHVYIVGYTINSVNHYPTTTGAYNETVNGGLDVFVSRLNNNLTFLVSSTLIGGSLDDKGNAIALDSSNNVYITGTTQDAGTDYPRTTGAYGLTHNGDWDVFVSKLNSALTTLSASTLIGGSGYDFGHSIALDTSNNVYITGGTEDAGTDYPATTGAYRLTQSGNYDTFVSKFNNTLSALTASTLIGGSGDDFGYSIMLDSSNNVFISGETYFNSTNYPATTGAYDTANNGTSGHSDAFVSKFNNALTALSASTFLGGNDDEAAVAILHDSSDRVYVVGGTGNATTNFPVTTGAYDTTHNGDFDAFIAILDNNLSASGSSTVSSGSSTSVAVGTGGTATVSLPAGNDLSVTLPAGTAGTVTVTDTNSGQSAADIAFLGTITDIDVSSNGCAAGCTVSFTFTGAQASAQGLTPSQVVIYHDSDENGSFEEDESISTTITGNDPYTATGAASFTSKFAVGGVVRANAVAAAPSLAGGGYFGFLNSCDSNGFGSGQSLRVYSISYDKCEKNDLDIIAYSTCGPITVEATTKNGRYVIGMPSNQPFLNDKEKKVVFGSAISPELESVNILVKDKRDSFTDKIMLDQCSVTKTYGITGYTSEQQSTSIPSNAQPTPTSASVPSWIKNNAGWWSSGQIGDDEFEKGLEYLIKNNIILVDKTVSSEDSQSNQVPSWIKNNAGWWSAGQITDSEFIKGIEYLIKNGIIKV